MSLRHKIALVFLFLGFVFSSIIRLRFNLAQGFEFHQLWITWIPSFFHFALLSSSEHALTSTFLGYIFFIASGVLMLKQFQGLPSKDKSLVIFLGLSAFALFFELISLFQDLFLSYYGQHMHIGLLLLIMGSGILIKIYKKTNVRVIKPLNQSIEGY